MDKFIQFVGGTILLLLITTDRPDLFGQPPGYQSPGLQPGTQPYLRAPGYSGPPLSTALPTGGPFSAGIQMPQGAPTGASVGGGASFFPQRPAYPNVVQNTANLPQSYLPVIGINGQWMSGYAMYRGVTRGLRF